MLDDGEAVGMGTHEELLESCQVYREIYESQYQDKTQARPKCPEPEAGQAGQRIEEAQTGGEFHGAGK